MKYSPTLVKAFLLFPLNVMGVIPVLILWLSGKFDNFIFVWLQTVAGGVLIVAGLVLCWVTVNWFTEVGEGTPAPWAPPKKLVVRGVYRHVRNPMMLGIWSVLMGEAILFASMPVLIWFAIFCGLSLVFVPLWEEPDIERRLGEEYRVYKKNVPRWIPRFTPWMNADAE